MISIKVRKTIIGHLLFALSFILIKFRIIRDEEKVIRVLNKLICNDRIFKMRVNDDKWIPIDMSDHEFVLSDD